MNIRMPQHLHGKVQEAAKQMELPIADVVRYAIGLGLKDLELLGFDIDKVMHDAVLAARSMKET